MIRSKVKKVLTVTEEGIKKATGIIYERLKIVVEPSGALGLAGVLEHKEEFAGSRVGVVVTGGNL